MRRARWVLLRHGESTANRSGIYSGWEDVALTLLGEQQARTAGEQLRGVRFERVLCSDLQRARRTAEIAVAAAGLQGVHIQTHPAFRERHLGDWQGRERAAVRATHPEQMLLAWDRSPPGGEQLGFMVHRLVAGLAALPRAEGPTLFVAHGGVIRIMLSLLAEEPLSELWKRRVPNAIPIETTVDPEAWSRVQTRLPAP
ncbi:MAG: histidine phosphatase family protein [Myxococcota bacterium]|nr:histidine phosphatase family protein [Myxococcota bacterium]